VRRWRTTIRQASSGADGIDQRVTGAVERLLRHVKAFVDNELSQFLRQHHDSSLN
jgi:hypothetical protein